MHKVLAIALTTFRESIRGKVLYTLLFFAALVVVLASFFGAVTIGEQIKVIKNLGLFSISFFSIAYAVISGASLLHKELSRRTVFNVLSKPVERWQFVTGKYLGMVATLLVMIALMGAGFSLYALMFDGALDTGLLMAYYYIALEMSVVCAVSIFFSAIVVTPLLSGLFTFSVFLAGRSIEFIDVFIHTERVGAVLRPLLTVVYWALPHLAELAVADGVVYGHHPAPAHLLWATAYTAGYSATLLAIAVLLFTRREFN